MSDQPIEVSENAFMTQIMSAGRSLLTAGISYAVGKGYFDAATGSQILSGLVILLPVVISQAAAYSKHRKLMAVAQVAQSK